MTLSLKLHNIRNHYFFACFNMFFHKFSVRNIALWMIRLAWIDNMFTVYVCFDWKNELMSSIFILLLIPVLLPLLPSSTLPAGRRHSYSQIRPWQGTFRNVSSIMECCLDWHGRKAETKAVCQFGRKREGWRVPVLSVKLIVLWSWSKGSTAVPCAGAFGERRVGWAVTEHPTKGSHF